jgi:hypothetical protein
VRTTFSRVQSAILIVAVLITVACGSDTSEEADTGDVLETRRPSVSAPPTVKPGPPSDPAPEATPATGGATASASEAVLVGAGDIARNCIAGDDLKRSEATAALLDTIPGDVFAAGDLAYDDGTAEQFNQCYEATWGRHKERTRPVPGNHDYHTPNGSGYHGYFGAAAGEPGQGWYSFELGAWHVIVLNSNCSDVGGCGPGDAQYEWLQNDLAANSGKTCTAALWHHPVFTAGPHEDDEGGVRPLLQLLYDTNADLVVTAHDHYYQRWAPMDPVGRIDNSRGLREFVVGTGGKGLYTPERSPANMEVENHDTYGVLKLTLHTGSYGWEFVPVAGQTFTDSGTQACH